MIATLGAVQIANIKKQTYDGAGAGADAAPAAQAVSAMAVGPQPVTEVLGASTEGQIADTRVYVLESDITSTVKKVNVTESESRY